MLEAARCHKVHRKHEVDVNTMISAFIEMWEEWYLEVLFQRYYRKISNASAKTAQSS